MVWKKRRIVPGCTAVLEDSNFRQEIKVRGHAFCPVHQNDNSICGCPGKTAPLILHQFPKSPGQRKVWLTLIGLETDFLPSTNDRVCSRHFDSGGQRKV